jgi:hypothetical protein
MHRDFHHIFLAFNHGQVSTLTADGSSGNTSSGTVVHPPTAHAAEAT